jgi:hypothetical protein
MMPTWPASNNSYDIFIPEGPADSTTQSVCLAYPALQFRSSVPAFKSP